MDSHKINTYVCGELQPKIVNGAIVIGSSPSGHTTVVRKIDEGASPFMIKCRHPGCKENAYSKFFPEYAQQMNPTHELYRPDPKELKTLEKTDRATWFLCAVRGQLLVREIVSEAEPNRNLSK